MYLCELETTEVYRCTYELGTIDVYMCTSKLGSKFRPKNAL